MVIGASTSISRSNPPPDFGNAITSGAMPHRPAALTMQIAEPKAMPPCGGAPKAEASNRNPNFSLASSWGQAHHREHPLLDVRLDEYGCCRRQYLVVIADNVIHIRKHPCPDRCGEVSRCSGFGEERGPRRSMVPEPTATSSVSVRPLRTAAHPPPTRTRPLQWSMEYARLACRCPGATRSSWPCDRRSAPRQPGTAAWPGLRRRRRTAQPPRPRLWGMLFPATGPGPACDPAPTVTVREVPSAPTLFRPLLPGHEKPRRRRVASTARPGARRRRDVKAPENTPERRWRRRNRSLSGVGGDPGAEGRACRCRRCPSPQRKVIRGTGVVDARRRCSSRTNAMRQPARPGRSRSPRRRSSSRCRAG